MRRLVVASAILAALLTWPLANAGAATPTPTPASAPTDSERATAALRYLVAAQLPDGSLDGSLGETADLVIGTAAVGYDPATLHGCGATTGALEFLATASDAATGDAAKTGKAVLAVVAAEADPADFEGRDLLARLGALYHSDTGDYGDGSTFSQSFAILGLAASGQAVPSAAIERLEALQDPDGSWSYGTAPVPAGEGDTNSTAIALMALAATGDHSADLTGLAYLDSQQLADGGFLYSSAWGPSPSDPDSDAIVLQALVATGQDPEGSSWLQGSNSVLTHLRSIQAADGGFAYPGMSPNAFTTSQVPAALVRTPYGAAVHPTPGLSLPAPVCPTVSPSPTLTPSPTARPTARPTVRPTSRPAAEPTIEPTAEATPSPSSTPTSSPTAPAPTGSASPSSDVGGATAAATGSSGGAGGAGSSGPLPAGTEYVLAALLALVVVLGGGWVALVRPGRRS